MNSRKFHAVLLVLLALTCSTPSVLAYRDLETRTFLTRDPAGFVDGPNVYTYVRQNPWTKFDPLGLQGTADRTIQMAEAKLRSKVSGSSEASEFQKVNDREIKSGAVAAAGQIAGISKGGLKTAAYAGALVQGKIQGNDPIVNTSIDDFVDSVMENIVDTNDPGYIVSSEVIHLIPLIATMGRTNTSRNSLGPSQRNQHERRTIADPLPAHPKKPAQADPHVPDPAADGPHTTVGTRTDPKKSPEPYTQGITFDADKKPVTRIDVTTHGRGDHDNPHQHRYDPKIKNPFDPEKPGNFGPAEPMNDD